MPGGRPSKYTKQLGNLICDLLAQGNSLRKICKMEDMPHFVTVFRWINENEEFSKQYRIARDTQQDYFMDEIIDISDDSTEDEIFTDEGKRLLNKEFVQRSKLRIETRMWVMARMAPKKYGSKIAEEKPDDNGLAESIASLAEAMARTQTSSNNG